MNQNQTFTDGNGNMFQMVNGQMVQVVPAGQQQAYVPQQPVQQNQIFGSGFNTMIQGVILGHLGADPEFRTAGSNGRLCCNFRVAINRVYTVGEGPQAQTVNKKSWLKVACFGKRAEKQQGVLRKGSWVLVPFSWVDVHPYQDKTNPQVTRTSTEFHADKVIWLFKKQDNAYQQPTQQFVPNQPVQGQQPVQPNQNAQFVQGQPGMQQQPAQYNPQTDGYQPFQQNTGGTGNVYSQL